MSIDEAALAAELTARHGVTTTRRLESIGVGRRALDALVRRGRLRRAGRGVFTSTSSPATFEQRMAEACAVTGGVVSFPTAGQVWKLRKTPRTNDVHLWLPEARRARPKVGVRVHLTRHLPDADIVRRSDGIVLTSPPRTAFDAAAWLDADDLESLIEHGIDLGYFLIPTLWRINGTAGCRGRPGSARFAEVLSGAAGMEEGIAVGSRVATRTGNAHSRVPPARARAPSRSPRR